MTSSIKCWGKTAELRSQFQRTTALDTTNKSHYSELLVQSCHERLRHSGERDTLTQVREQIQIWIGRQLVIDFVSSCYICRKLKVKAAQQITAPLPRYRVTKSPFEATAVDFSEPFYVGEENWQTQGMKKLITQTCISHCSNQADLEIYFCLHITNSIVTPTL